MGKIQTLNEIQHLESSGYGRPWPRHGLQLLYWFCNEYVTFNNNGDLKALENPKRRKYGFHSFDNRLEYDDHQLLPKQNWPYYEVGNLNAQRADDLPSSVKDKSTVDDNLSNMDRIIISLHPDLIVNMVYVTQHKNKSSFDRQYTFRISKGLVKIIRNLTLEGLLFQVEYKPPAAIMVLIKRPAHSNNRIPVSKSEPVNHRMPSVSSAPSSSLFLHQHTTHSHQHTTHSHQHTTHSHHDTTHSLSPPALQYKPVSSRDTDDDVPERCCCVIL